MKYTVSLKENHIFRRLYRKGNTAADSRLAIYVRRNGRPGNRLGLTVSTKVGHAVVRNRLRRRLREIYRLHEASFQPGWDLVVVARSRAVQADYRTLERSFLSLAKKLGLLREEGSHGEARPS